MFDQDELREILVEKLPSYRWWPWRNTRRDIEFIEFIETDKGLFILFKSGQYVFQLPLTFYRERNELVEILGERVIKYRDLYLVEAEYTPRYFELLSLIKDVIVKTYREIRGRIAEAKPLTLETTNIVAIHRFDNGLELVVKSYRLLSKIDLEPRLMIKLSNNGFRNIPLLYKTYMYRDKYLSIVTRYVKGEADGGYPFYMDFREYFNRKRGEYCGREYLARKLGFIIADMHLILNPYVSKEFFGLEEIGVRDIGIWVKRFKNRVGEISSRLDKYIGETRGRERRDLEYWYKLFTNSMEKILKNIESDLEKLFLHTYKGRIHQDLHLAQMIYLEGRDEFIITDFEGEPGRSDEERVMKEPLIRDLATMTTSFHYLSFMAYHSLTGSKDLMHTAKKLVKQHKPVTWSWSMRQVVNMVLAYTAATSRDRIGRDLYGYRDKPLTHYFHRYLSPWIVERILYEILYEMNYRPEWFVVPLTALIHSPIPLDR